MQKSYLYIYSMHIKYLFDCEERTGKCYREKK